MTCLFRALAASLALGLSATASAAKPESQDVCADTYGASLQGGEPQARPLFERFICLMRFEAPAKPAELLGPATAIDWQPALDIGFQPLSNPVLADIATGAELVDTVNFASPPKIDFDAFGNLAQPGSLTVGESAVWMVTPGGLRVFDAKTKRWSFSAKVSAEQVRPKDAILDGQGGNVWFFGRELYQYETATHRIYRYKPGARSFRVIRKVAPVAGGLWLATDGGAFFFDARRKTFQQLQSDAKRPAPAFTQVAAGKSGVWFSGGDAQFLRIQQNGERLSAQISKPLGGVPPVELAARDDGLWMLHSLDQGRSYQLATIPAGDPALLVGRYRLYSLREADGQLLASAYDKLFRIDTGARRMVQINADVASIGSLALGKHVLFSGTSYVNYRSTGSVSRYMLDLSKGWQQPAARIVFEGWEARQPGEMFNYLPAVLETAGNPREVWFLIAVNLSNPRFDRTVAARYDKRTGRSEVFFSRWSKDAGQTQVFTVDSIATAPARQDRNPR